MAVKAIDYKLDHIANGKRYVITQLQADTKAEVVAVGNDGSKVVNLTKDDIIEFGSSAVTSSLEVGQIKSDGTWKF